MHFILEPWQLYLVILVGWVQRQQQEVIEYLIMENKTLKELWGLSSYQVVKDRIAF
jgi:hypothetical protein